MTACTECHGANLQGWPFLGSPSLAAAAAYSPQNFAHLMRTGFGLGDRDLGLMTEVGKERFSSFTEDEVTAIHAYLQEFARQGGSTLP
jgi:cytochrome c553